jgi:hypothetical protein
LPNEKKFAFGLRWGLSMKLRFGTYIGVLTLCGIEHLTKGKLANVIVKSVDKNCALNASAVTRLLQCTSNLPGGRYDSLGGVVDQALEADPALVTEYFKRKIIPLLNPDKRKMDVLAIR